jgi:flagellar hook-associated protein 3 FlgL
MIGRVATFSEVNYLMTLNMSTQDAMSTAETQESSGLVSQTYGGLGGGDASQVLNIDNQISRLTADGDNATTALSSMQETYSTMTSVTTLSTTVLSDLSSFMSGGTTDSTTLTSDATSWLSQLTDLLNTQYDGSYLFSGTATDTAPVDTSSSSYDPTADPTTADTGYYQGSSTGTTYTGSDGFTVSTSVQADSSGFEEMLRGLSMIIASPSDSSTLSQAYDLIQSGSSSVASEQATLSTDTAALTAYQEDSSAKVTTLTTLASGLKESDLSAATVLVTNYQSQLEASYETLTKLMTTNLTQYLT